MRQNAIRSDLGAIVSLRHLEHLLGMSRSDLRRLAHTANTRYRPFEMKGGSKTRLIDNPKVCLKRVQSLIKARLLETVKLPEYVMGGIKGRSAMKNAKAHVGSQNVVTCDIADFFPSISADDVRRLWIEVFGAGREIATLLTLLTTRDGYLPHGAPTSLHLAVLHLLPATEAIDEVCKRQGSTFTVYVDDLAVSGVRSTEAIPAIVHAVKARGLRIKSAKTRVRSNGQRQVVTGFVVNRKVSVKREFLGAARRIAHSALRSGSQQELAAARGKAAFIAYAAPHQARFVRRRLGMPEPIVRQVETLDDDIHRRNP